VGFSDGGRRRTPGLRREEVARLADVGVSWYTWLEQGRDIHVSEPLLERLAAALRLSSSERAHLFELAHGRPAARREKAPSAVGEALQRILDAHPYPALVATRRWDILGWNDAACILYGDLASLSPEERNGLWSMFMNPERRAQMPNWEAAVRTAVAGFRGYAARAADRTEFDALVAKLSRVSPDFVRFWNEHHVLEVRDGRKMLTHREVGLLEFEHVTLHQIDAEGNALGVIFYSPRPGESTTRARRLFGLDAPTGVAPSR
jgi:PAS domain-containing protein